MTREPNLGGSWTRYVPSSRTSLHFKRDKMTTRGMMAENMFQGKGVVLGWLNSVLSLRLEKIEDVSRVGAWGVGCLLRGSPKTLPRG